MRIVEIVARHLLGTIFNVLPRTLTVSESAVENRPMHSSSTVGGLGTHSATTSILTNHPIARLLMYSSSACRSADA